MDALGKIHEIEYALGRTLKESEYWDVCEYLRDDPTCTDTGYLIDLFALAASHYVAFLDDDGRLYIKNQRFASYEAAKHYADGIAKSRRPRIMKEV